MNVSPLAPGSQKPRLGRLERVELRQCWSDEARDFTPWLAQEENIALLGEAIGLELEVEAQELSVGPFRADIFCKDTITGHFVLIENQLERTDHIHLGQLLTYAAGLEAVTIIWVARQFTDEHRAALDWLNGITNTTINFFGLEIELWRIGDSPMAPKFNVVSKPNDWSKTVRELTTSAGPTTPSSTQQLHVEFWTQFRQYMESHGSAVHIQKPLPQYWTNVAVGRTYFTLVAWNGMRDGRSGVYLQIWGSQAKPHFHLLRERYRDQVESRLGQVEWRELPENKESQIALARTSAPADRNTWPELDQWFAETIENWVNVFRPIVKDLNAADYQPTEESSGIGDDGPPPELPEDGSEPLR